MKLRKETSYVLRGRKESLVVAMFMVVRGDAVDTLKHKKYLWFNLVFSSFTLVSSTSRSRSRPLTRASSSLSSSFSDWSPSLLCFKTLTVNTSSHLNRICRANIEGEYVYFSMCSLVSSSFTAYNSLLSLCNKIYIKRTKNKLSLA